MNKEQLAAKISAMKGQQPTEPTKAAEQPKPQPIAKAENKTNLNEIPQMLKNLLGIVETIEESHDTSKEALIKASEQVERCKAYIVYLKSILPILEAKAGAMIEAKHKPQPIEILNHSNPNLN
jgi:hypothetical protein